MTHRIASDVEEEPVSIQPWSIESYADSLMDELFDEVDKILEGGVKLPPEPAPHEQVALQPLAIPKMVLPPVVIPQSALALQQQNNTLNTYVVNTVETSDLERKPSRLLDKLLLAVASLSMAVTAALWLSSQGKLPWIPSPTANQVQAPPTTVAQNSAEIQFVNYLQRSLEILDQGSPAPKTAQPVAAAPVPTPNLPTVSVAANPSQSPNRPPAVLERVYIPVYQPPQALNGLPTTSSNPVGAPATLVPVPPTTVVAAAPIPPTIHTLVGVLELGKRSAALFEINGVAQRVHIGEGIASSGWTLVKVVGQEAIIRRNGEVRSIYVGQKF